MQQSGHLRMSTKDRSIDLLRCRQSQLFGEDVLVTESRHRFRDTTRVRHHSDVDMDGSPLNRMPNADMR
jgi:hypothetical protein